MLGIGVGIFCRTHYDFGMTIRYFAILTACIGIALILNQPLGSTVVVQTGRELDVAIVGQGYICVEDTETGESRFTRNGDLQIDLFGYLVTRIQGRTWRIEPGIPIPSDWERVAVLSDGHVQYLQSGSWMSAGQVQLAKFASSQPFADPFVANKEVADTGLPMKCNPGTQGLGVFQQGWIERPSVTRLQVAANLLTAFLASLVINSFVGRPPVVSG